MGFNATIKTVPTLAVGQVNVRNGNYQIITFQGSSSPEVDDWTYLFWNTSGGRNLQGYSSPKMDELTVAQRSAKSTAERQQVVNQIQELMLSDMVAAPLIHHAKQHEVLNPVVKKFQAYPPPHPRFHRRLTRKSFDGSKTITREREGRSGGFWS